MILTIIFIVAVAILLIDRYYKPKKKAVQMYTAVPDAVPDVDEDFDWTGWSSYIYNLPDRNETVMFKRRYSTEEWTGKASDLYPAFNVANLYWKPIKQEKK